MNRRTLPAAVLGAVFGIVAAAGMVGSALDAPQVAAQDVNRVAVVVEGYGSRCVEFTGESITGLQALQMAGFDPIVRGYSGEGGAVCALAGLGCPADSSCLTCRAPNYWAYHRAGPGAGGYSYSSIGAGSTTVTDGSVEAWRWGTGAAPGFVSFNAVCPLEPPPTTTTTTTLRPGGGNPGGGPGPGPGQGGNGPTGGTGTTDGPGATPADGQPGASTTTVAPTTTRVGEGGGPREGGQGTDRAAGEADTALQGEDAAAVSPLDDEAGGPGLRTALAFVALLAGFGFAGWRIRRLRAR